MSRWFAVIDCAQDPRLLSLVERCAERQNLLAGPIDEMLARACPHLVAIDESEPLLGIWREHGVGKSWGIMIETELPFDRVRRHLRHFLQARLPDGSVGMFRFFDPRVFHIFAQAAPGEQLASLFAGLRQIAAEDDAGLPHHFRWRSDRLEVVVSS